jgi:hypothetical protein
MAVKQYADARSVFEKTQRSKPTTVVTLYYHFHVGAMNTVLFIFFARSATVYQMTHARHAKRKYPKRVRLARINCRTTPLLAHKGAIPKGEESEFFPGQFLFIFFINNFPPGT